MNGSRLQIIHELEIFHHLLHLRTLLTYINIVLFEMKFCGSVIEYSQTSLSQAQ